MNKVQDKKRFKLSINNIIFPLLFLIVIAAGYYFRFTGLFWGENQYLHPDERFLIWVTNDVSAVSSISEYFNTQNSSLNPNNVGHGFYVYGDFPIIFTRYVTELVFDQFGWNEITEVGRSLSSFFDLASVLLIFLIGEKLFNKKIGLLASTFSAFAVLQIQQSHFYTVDTFATFFSTLAVYIAVRITKSNVLKPSRKQSDEFEPGNDNLGVKIDNLKLLAYAVFFGLVVGLSAASKINTIVVAVILPVSYLILWNRYNFEDPFYKFELITRDLIIAGIIAFISFRIFQPYAFAGPDFFGITLNPKWLANMKEVSALTKGNVDYPPALQWARRDFLFAAKNITLWGLGIPMSMLVWPGLILMGWKTIRGNWHNFGLIWLWTAGYFVWQSSGGNPTMRYQLPVYPMFALVAAWFVFQLIEKPTKIKFHRKYFKILGFSLGIVAVIGSIIWSFMFTRIYVEPITRVAASRWIYENVPGPINLMVEKDGQITQDVLSIPYEHQIESGKPYSKTFIASSDGILNSISFANIIRSGRSVADDVVLKIGIYDIENSARQLSEGYITNSFTEPGNGKGIFYNVDLVPEVNIIKGKAYQLVLELNGLGTIKLSGSAVAVESDWDDSLPMRVDGRDAYGGIYQGDLNFQMYWDDDAAKLNRFIDTLNKSDYIFISSNRQWGTTTRVPERYPLTTQYYQSLLGCPEDNDIYWCYSVAKPGLFNGELGFELIKVFESFPHLGYWQINDQFAEEAFTVYDHPKVLIFKKSEDFSIDHVSNILQSVDLTKVIDKTPVQFPDYPALLELPEERLQNQQAGGTWSDLFNREAFINKYPLISVLFWYLTITLFGWILFPLIRLMLPGQVDRGFAFSKLIGLLLVALFVWWAGSAGIVVTRILITIIVAVLSIIGIALGFIQRQEIRLDFQKYKRYYLIVEILGLLLFLIFLFIRIGNPDLWHPAKGGEKPMDFSYLNAVIKSSTFPPYDPWYAGGYINYYYYGFVIVGIWVKLLGIIPSIAYNLILPTLFSMMGLGAFSVGWNIHQVFGNGNLSFFSQIDNKFKSILKSKAFWSGIAAIFLVLILGNLGTVRMIWHGLQKLGSPSGNIDVANMLERLNWTFNGLIDLIKGQKLPFYPGDWYWVPSRALPNEPITEFPFFTFIYADLHAHLIALPITILVIGWSISVLASKWKFEGIIHANIQKTIVLLLGALTIGTLRPTNTWDFPTYLIFAIFVTGYTIFKYGNGFKLNKTFSSKIISKFVETSFVIAILVLIAFVLYKPFSDWYGQAYNTIDLYKGSHTPFSSYFTHWGLFLFIIFSWFISETIQWMAETPLSSLRKLSKYQGYILFVILAVVAAIILLNNRDVNIAWFVVPMAVWAGVLIIRKRQSDMKRFVLFMIGTAFVLTLLVEKIVLRGDIGRMNTVFKFYLQAWTLFGLGAAAGLIWTIPEINKRWHFAFTGFWQIVLAVLVGSAGLYPLLATAEKIDDRISHLAPHSLDGMAYMEFSHYFDEGVEMNLEKDFLAIQWMQDNISGSQVIVEGNTVEYRWGNRYTIYTGLPGVIGWNWHQRQQRAVLPSEWILKRVDELNDFYLTIDQNTAGEFLEKYDVKYIVLGQFERAKYSGPGLLKFDLYNGKLWNEVYRDGNTVIYEVIS
jgi:YYY domain-containing protein